MSRIQDAIDKSNKEAAERAAAEGGSKDAEQQTQQANQNSTEKPAESNGTQTQATEQKAPEYNEEGVLNFLSERQGTKFDSLDSVFKKPEPTNSFANEDVAKINKFVSETGRSPQEYYKMNRDINDVSDTDILRENYLENGGTEADFEIEYNLDLQPISEDDGYTAQEVASRDREIRKRDINLKKEATAARGKFDELKNKLSQPIEGFIKPEDKQNKGRENWSAQVSEAVQGFDLGIEGYKHESTPEELTERYSSIESVMDSFKNEKGEFQFKKMIRAFEVAKNIDSILKVTGQQSANSATEKIIEGMERPNSSQNEQQHVSDKDAEKEAIKAKLRNHYKR